MKKDKLVKAAILAREKAYAPYSRYKVGAAILGSNGKIYTGCNVENASYGLAICAERVAIFKAVSDGVKKFKRIAIATGSSKPGSPCGACRQVMAEFCHDIKIIITNSKGVSRKTTLTKLLPDAFRLRKL